MSVNKEKTLKDFLATFEEIVKFLSEDLKTEFEVIERHRKYVERIIRYNCLGGKYNRGLFVQTTLINYKKGQVTDEELLKARVAGWCVEWLQAFFLIADDMMDNSITRRGKDCWYRLDDVSLIACNDFIIVEAQIYRILKHYFKNDKEKYHLLVDLFLESTYQTSLGQLNDLRLLADVDQKKKLNLDLFTEENYRLIVKYKTAFYSFYLPVACGLIIAGVDDDKIFEETRKICISIGEYFQIQDDYLDCYADPEVLGKIGRDIEEAKCCWLVVQALKRCTPQQRQIIQDNYGQEDAEKVSAIKQLYKDFNMEKIFADYEENAAQDLKKMIGNSVLKSTGNEMVYEDVFNAIFKRNK